MSSRNNLEVSYFALAGFVIFTVFVSFFFNHKVTNIHYEEQVVLKHFSDQISYLTNMKTKLLELSSPGHKVLESGDISSARQELTELDNELLESTEKFKKGINEWHDALTSEELLGVLLYIERERHNILVLVEDIFSSLANKKRQDASVHMTSLHQKTEEILREATNIQARLFEKRSAYIEAQGDQVSQLSVMQYIILIILPVLVGCVTLYGISLNAKLENDRIDREKKNDDLLIANTKLEAMNKELESFCYSISHDLRAPLRSINGFSQILTEDLVECIDSDSRDYLNRIRNSAVTMGVMIDDLLQLSRVARSDIQFDAVDLSELAQELIDILRQQDINRKVNVQIEPNIIARGDKGLLRIVLQNLLDNAWKYTRKNENAQINFGQKSIGQQLVYSVTDNGIGFEMDYIEKIFGPFQRLHHNTEFEGSGIGLATVHKVISRHGGNIWAESVPQKGSSFYFTLPQLDEKHSQHVMH